jgi:hypothetical protein
MTVAESREQENDMGISHLLATVKPKRGFCKKTNAADVKKLI